MGHYLKNSYKATKHRGSFQSEGGPLGGGRMTWEESDSVWYLCVLDAMRGRYRSGIWHRFVGELPVRGKGQSRGGG